IEHQLKLKNTDTKQFNTKNTKNSGTWPGNTDQITNTKFTPKNTLQKRINTISVKFRIIKDKPYPIFISFSDGSKELCQLCVSNTQSVELVRSHAGFRARRLNHCAIPADKLNPKTKGKKSTK